MEVKENCCCDGAYDDECTRQALYTSNAMKRSAKIAIASNVLVPMPPQSLSLNHDLLSLMLGM
jgi:hypothetical protein